MNSTREDGTKVLTQPQIGRGACGPTGKVAVQRTWGAAACGGCKEHGCAEDYDNPVAGFVLGRVIGAGICAQHIVRE